MMHHTRDAVKRAHTRPGAIPEEVERESTRPAPS